MNGQEQYAYRRDQNMKVALMSLKEKGIPARLCCAQNGHIQATGKHGVVFNYYSGTGTITGYYNEDVTPEDGLKELIRLCEL
jgi:hypothetical protein